MLAIGKDELAKLPPLGKTVKCWKCGKRHHVQAALAGLSLFKCKGTTYLCGIGGKAWRPARTDCTCHAPEHDGATGYINPDCPLHSKPRKLRGGQSKPNTVQGCHKLRRD